MNTPVSATTYKNHRFPVEILSRAVWWYFRFCLSFRDVEELLFERGVVMTYEPVMKHSFATQDEIGAIERIQVLSCQGSRHRGLILN